MLFIYQFKTFVFKCNLFFCVGRGRGNGGKVKTHSDHGFIIRKPILLPLIPSHHSLSPVNCKNDGSIYKDA